MKAGIRYLFSFYGRVCLAGGLALSVLLAVLWLFKLLLDWQTPIAPGDWYTFVSGFIILTILIGPYVVTVGQLAKVQRAANVRIQTGPPLSKERRRLWLLAGAILGLIFLAALIITRSFIVWFTFGSLFSLLGLVLLYIAWQIERIEKAANMIIYAQDYSWRFDSKSYFGVLNRQTPTRIK